MRWESLEGLIGIAIVVTHLLLTFLMFALWIVRKVTGTWRELNAFEHDWDIAQKGAVLHCFGIITLCVSTLCLLGGLLGPRENEWTLLPSIAGIFIAGIGCMGFLGCGVDTHDRFPAKRSLSRWARTTGVAMGLMVILALLSGGSPDAPVVLLFVFCITAVAAIVCGITSFGVVILYSFREHREIRCSGRRMGFH